MKGEVQMEETPSSSSFALDERDTDPLIPMKKDDDGVVNKFSPSSLTEIVKAEFDDNGGEGSDDDLEAGCTPCCRICLECDGEDGKITNIFILINFFFNFYF